ncbi:MAG TPA: MFS transporter [Candidatus Angelobacter sp.]|jgi:ACS family hexuronate transporter-like MFS transporter
MKVENSIATPPAGNVLSSVAPVAASRQETLTQAVGHYRWTICALLFFGTTMNYVDRQVLGLLAPELQSKIGWNEAQYGYIVTAFQGAYALGLLLMGRLIDVIGTRIGYALSIGIWSLSAAAHALARTPLGFGAARFALGIGEAGNFPAGIKTVAEWFPKKERALATGIFNSGTNVGATIGPLLVLWIASRYGWQSAFISTGLLSFIPIIFWVRSYRRPQEHPRLSRAELEYIQSDPSEPATQVPWKRLLPHRQTWAFLLGKFMTDPIWWFFLFWLPKFLNAKHGLELTALGPPLVVIYNAACIGSIGGGWLAARFLKAGWTVNRARKTTMLICALMIVPIVAAANVHSLWGAVALVSLAAAGHQGWSANMFTFASDLFPRRAVASVVGIGGFGGAVGGMLIAAFTGWVLQVTGSYLPMFIIAGSTYLIALCVIHLLTPSMEPAKVEVAA